MCSWIALEFSLLDLERRNLPLYESVLGLPNFTQPIISGRWPCRNIDLKEQYWRRTLNLLLLYRFIPWEEELSYCLSFQECEKSLSCSVFGTVCPRFQCECYSGFSYMSQPISVTVDLSHISKIHAEAARVQERHSQQ